MIKQMFVDHFPSLVRFKRWSVSNSYLLYKRNRYAGLPGEKFVFLGEFGCNLLFVNKGLKNAHRK